MVAKTLNPMDAFRREQKKKELKKNRTERQKAKQAKLSTLDPDEIQDQIKKLERQILTNPTDGPTRKRKQELEDTLKSVVKKRKEMEEEQRKQSNAAPSAPKTLKDLEIENRERFKSPENSIYYHPTLNPFGAPPPGKPQMYRVPPPMPMARPPPPPHQHNRQHSQRGPPRFPPRGPRGPPRYDGRNGIPPPPPPPRSTAPASVAPKRPGKRPPFPPGPIPPGIIQVPPRPPLPTGPSPFQPPPPPPGGSRYAPPPDARHIDTPPASAINESEQFDSYDAEEDTDAPSGIEESDVVAPYPPPEDAMASPEPDQTLDDEEMEEQRAQLRSLVPLTLRVQRKPTARPTAIASRSIVSAPGPRPPPLAMRPPPPPPRPAAPVSPIAPPSVDKPSGGEGSVSKEFDAFMDEVKDLL